MARRDERLVALSSVLECAANTGRAVTPEIMRLAARIVRGYDGAKDLLAAYRTGGRPSEWAFEATAVADEALREASRSAPTPPDPFRVGPGATEAERVPVLDHCGQAPCPQCKTVLTNEGRVCGRCRPWR